MVGCFYQTIATRWKEHMISPYTIYVTFLESLFYENQLRELRMLQLKKIRLGWGEIIGPEELSCGVSKKAYTLGVLQSVRLRAVHMCQLNMRKIIRGPFSLYRAPSHRAWEATSIIMQGIPPEIDGLVRWATSPPTHRSCDLIFNTIFSSFPKLQKTRVLE